MRSSKQRQAGPALALLPGDSPSLPRPPSLGRTGTLLMLFALVGFLALHRPPALAHVPTAPTRAQAGTQTDIGFVVEHGCYGTSTTALAVVLPPGVKGAPKPVPGFEARVDEASGIVRWSGGPLADSAPATFSVTLTLPPTPGRTLSFPTTQTCQQGQIEWRETPLPGQDPDDLDTPAPTLELTADAPPASAPRADVSAAGAETRQNLPVGGIAAGGGGTSKPASSPGRTLLGLLLPVVVALAATAGGRRPGRT